MSKIRLYAVGIFMGIADLIPGVSGGTVAFLCGIYEKLLASIQTLRVQPLKHIAWPFLLPLGGGIATSILLFSKLFYFLLLFYKAPLYGFFFGLIAASTYTCAKEAELKKAGLFFWLVLGGSISYLLTLLPSQLLFGSGFFGILLAGMLGTGAMLLPGISGSFLLQVLGVYPLVLYSLNSPIAPGSLKLLIAMGMGISLGFIVFSRAISFLLAKFRRPTLALLVGFMVGGIKSLWPFGGDNHLLPAFLLILGFSLIIFLDIKVKKRSVKTNIVLD
jgi:putative membrane protein